MKATLTKPFNYILLWPTSRLVQDSQSKCIEYPSSTKASSIEDTACLEPAGKQHTVGLNAQKY
eukprot:595073-Pelagomonas_calceolata.AAC.2